MSEREKIAEAVSEEGSVSAHDTRKPARPLTDESRTDADALQTCDDASSSPEIEIFNGGDHTIIHGSALDYLDTIPSGSVDLAFADPPYNIGKRFANSVDRWPSDQDYAQWCEAWISKLVSKLSPRGTMYLMTSTQAMPFVDLAVRDTVTVLSRIVWHYDSSGVQARSRYGSMYEPILHCVVNPKDYTFNTEAIMVEARTGAVRKLIDYRKKEPTVYNSKKVPGNVWYFPRVRYRMPEYEEHPTQKPEALLERIILASSNPGDLVLDPFAGTFTTCAVAKKLGRRSVGIELARDYVKVGLRRVGLRRELDGETLEGPKKNFGPRKKAEQLGLLEE